jgi:hypothetical protein
MTIPESFVETVAVVLAVRFVAVEARLEHASRRREVLVFHPILIVRLFIPVAVVSLYGGFQVAKTGEWLTASIGFGMSVFMFLNSLGTILVDKNFVRETRWLGLKRTQITWDDVVYAGGDLEDRVTVRSKDDHVISHTAYHVDRYGFIEALKKYCPQCSYNQRVEGPQPGPWVPLGSP